MSAEHVADWAIGDERDDPPGTRKIRICILDQESSWQEKITREEQSGLPIVISDMRAVVTRGRYHIDHSIAKIDLADTVRPVRNAEMAFHALEICRHHLEIWQRPELFVARSMVAMTVGVHDQQRQSWFSTRQQ